MRRRSASRAGGTAHRGRPQRGPQGSALVVAMLVLALAALLGLAAAQGAVFALRIAGAERDRAQLLANAENALERTLARRVPALAGAVVATESPAPGHSVVVTIEADRLAPLTAPPFGGYSLGLGRGFGAEHYVARSVATNARGGRTTIEQQFHLLVPESPP